MPHEPDPTPREQDGERVLRDAEDPSADTWMLVIAALIAVEKLLPWSSLSIRVTAAALTVIGLAVVLIPDRVPWLTIPMSM
jgi:hypothetical protein